MHLMTLVCATASGVSRFSIFDLRMSIGDREVIDARAKVFDSFAVMGDVGGWGRNLSEVRGGVGTFPHGRAAPNRGQKDVNAPR